MVRSGARGESVEIGLLDGAKERSIFLNDVNTHVEHGDRGRRLPDGHLKKLRQYFIILLFDTTNLILIFKMESHK